MGTEEPKRDPFSGNSLLATATPASRARLARHLERVELRQLQTITNATGSIDYIYFPVTALISLFVDMANGASAEIALIGNTGATGIMALMGGARMPFRAAVDTGGLAHRIRKDLLQAELPHCPALRGALMRYVSVRMIEIAGVAVCNVRHSVLQRLCRALLMRLDRAPGQPVMITQEMLAEVLGVHRPAVSEAALRLKQIGAIDYRRGRLEVLDRRMLLEYACECYHTIGQQITHLEDA